MNLRTQLMMANGFSIVFIFIFLLFSYFLMIIKLEAILVLSAVTIIAGILSFIVHFLLTRPIYRSIGLISEETKKIAGGRFEGSVPAIGPLEFRELAARINEMSGDLEKSFNQLQRSEASRRDLVANVSHDLRTPLASIQAFVEALQDGVIEDEAVFQKYLRTIQLETTRLSDLVDDLFHLTQLNSGTEPFQTEPYHLDDLIIETLENQFVQLEKNQFEVSIDMPDQMPPVAIVPHQVKRVLINLLQNAMRYSPSGSKIDIEVTNSADSFAKVLIQDEGEGIAEDDVNAVFNRFYRVEKSRNLHYGGTGLGLSIAKTIIEMHGGMIGVESGKGKGSTFWFTLPKYR